VNLGAKPKTRKPAPKPSAPQSSVRDKLIGAQQQQLWYAINLLKMIELAANDDGNYEDAIITASRRTIGSIKSSL